MKLASKLKLDQQPCPPSVASHLLHQVDAFLSAADKVSHPTALEDLNTLARKLDNPKLLDQCKVTRPIKQNVSVLFLFCPFRNFFLSPSSSMNSFTIAIILVIPMHVYIFLKRVPIKMSTDVSTNHFKIFNW